MSRRYKRWAASCQITLWLGPLIDPVDLSNCCLWVQLCHAWLTPVSHREVLLGAHQTCVKGQQRRLQGWFMECLWFPRETTLELGSLVNVLCHILLKPWVCLQKLLLEFNICRVKAMKKKSEISQRAAGDDQRAFKVLSAQNVITLKIWQSPAGYSGASGTDA